MENTIELDLEVSVPIGLIDPAKENPKTALHGVYRKGLEESVDYFGNRDRLKVRPKGRGRYECLNGNQRIDLFTEKLIDAEIKRVFQLEKDCPKSALIAIKEDPANSKKLAKIRKESVTWKIPCQVITQLNADEPFTDSDAKLFLATYDRNHAKYDETKEAELYRSVVNAQVAAASEERRKSIEQRVKAMIRPELPHVIPNHKPAINQQDFEFAQPGSFTPTEQEPWGPVPPAPDSTPQRVQSTLQEQFIPMVFSISASGYKEITDSILRSKSRIFREARLKSALEKLDKLLDDIDNVSDSVIVETALLILNKRIETAESDGSA